MSDMAIQQPQTTAQVPAGSRLEDLLAAYAELKPHADEMALRLKTVADGIKAELRASMPDARRIDVDHPALALPLRLTCVESWSVDTKRLKEEDPATYVRYARKGTKWDLRGQRP